MTKTELTELLRVLELDYEAEHTLLYVFCQHPDGRIDNFSMSVRRGETMSDASLVDLMVREYPAMRDAVAVRVERQEGRGTGWMDIQSVCEMLHISYWTLRSWTRRGLFRSYKVGRKVYYDRADIDRALRDHWVQENGRLDSTLVHPDVR